MKHRICAVIVGAIILAFAVSTASVAGSLLDGDDILNSSIEGVDIDNGTLTGSDVRNNSLDERDLGPDSVTSTELDATAADELLAAVEFGQVTASSPPDTNGAVTWDSPAAGVDNALVSMNYVVRGCSACSYTLTLTTTPGGEAPVTVTSCTVDPGGGTCSASGFAASLTAPTVTIEGDMMPDNPPTLDGSITAVAVNN